MSYSHIDSLINVKKYDEALAECEALLFGPVEEMAEVLRTRAYIYTLTKAYGEAFSDWKEIIAIGSGALQDYYLAANAALYHGAFDQAEKWLLDLLKNSDEQGEAWFLDGALFLLAYAQMHLGKLDIAIKSLDKAVGCDPKVAMPVPGHPGILENIGLRQEILQRANLSS